MTRLSLRPTVAESLTADGASYPKCPDGGVDLGPHPGGQSPRNGWGRSEGAEAVGFRFGGGLDGGERAVFLWTKRMSAILRAIHGSVLVVTAFAAAGVEAGGVDIVTDASLRDVGFERYWQGRVSVAHGDAVEAVDLLDENLYVRTREGTIQAVQADTGLLRWIEPLADRSFRDRRPSHVWTDAGDGPVLLVTKSQILVLDRYSGEELDRIALPFAAGGGAAADEFGIYLGGADGAFYSLRWLRSSSRKPLVRWRVGVAGRVMSRPVLTFDNRLYFVSDGGVVYCVRAGDKSLVWAYRTYSPVSGGLHVDESGVYVAAEDNRLYVLDRDRGRSVRRYLLPAPLFETPVVAHRTVYQHCAGAGVFAFDVDSREELWHVPDGRGFVSRAEHRVVIRSMSGDLLFVDNRTGEVNGRLALLDDVFAAQNRRDSVLYLVAPDGRMLCAKPAGFPYLRREEVAAARSMLHRRPASGQDADAGEESPADSTGISGRRPEDPLRSDGGRGQRHAP